MSNITWAGIGGSVTGYSHKRKNKPNQDALCILPESKSGLPIILTVADGHGSDRAFRSQLGSRFAVEVAGSILAESHNLTYAEVYDRTRQQLPQLIVREWEKKIEEDCQQNPFTSDERVHLLTESEIKRQRTKVPHSDEQIQAIIQKYPYGSTLLGVVITAQFIMYLQLGDGDILCLDKGGKVYRPFRTKDERLIANETTSLCMHEAWGDFRIVMQPYSEDSPVAILAATDGYGNSFASEELLFEDANSFYQWIKREGLSEVKKELDGILNHVSEKGSGDDVTLAVLTRMPLEEIPEQFEETSIQ